MKRQDEVLVGILTTIAVAILIAGTYWLSRGSFRGGYNLFTVVDWGAGLKTGQRVLFAGVSIGYVDDVELKREGKLVIKMVIEREDSVPLGSVASVQPAGLFGDMMVAIHPPGPGLRFHEEGDTIPSRKSAATPSDIVAGADSVTKSLQIILAGVQKQLVDAGTLAELRSTIVNTNRLVAQLSTVVAAQSAELSATMGSLRRTFAAVDSVRIDSTLRSFQKAGTNVEQLTAGLQSTTTKLDGIVGRLETGQGTAAKLLNDPALHDDLRGTVNKLNSLLDDFKANPRKYLDFSFSIFGGRKGGS